MLTKIFGTKSQRDVKRMSQDVKQINQIFESYKSLSEEELKGKTAEFRQRLSDGETEDDILYEAFATVKEACRRLLGVQYKVIGMDMTWDMVPFDVQLVGGIALHQGSITEMATGEGKTLAATMPVYLNILSGKGVHIITVNDYLARRDASWMGILYLYLGATIGVIQDRSQKDNSYFVESHPTDGVQLIPCTRKEAYQCDILHGTNAQFGFDYLYDNMAREEDQMVQRGFHYAIIDEVDSVLIDEARTPLIISGAVDHSDSDSKYQELMPKIKKLWDDQLRLTNNMTSQGEMLLREDDSEKEYEAGIHLLRVSRGAPKNKRLMKIFKQRGIKKLVQRVENDFIRDKKMPEIDDELCFAIDEKQNSVDLTDRGIDALAKNESREYFVLPDLSLESKKIEDDETLSSKEKQQAQEKLNRRYATQSEKLHTIHQLLKAFALFEKDVDYVVQENRVLIVDSFTGRLMPGRRYSDGLHQALEAKERVHVEGETQTLATITIQNFFRMYEKLAGMTGTAITEESEFYEIYKLIVTEIPTNKPICRTDHNDVIYRTKREKYNAIVEEVIQMHEQGRPVLVGTVSVDISEILGRALQRKRKDIPYNILNAKYHQREAEIVSAAGQPGAVTIATNMAGRGTDIKLGKGVSKNGGLHIIGTERHESRRIDRQLRGRSGRQGDPGSSKFFMCLEDNLMRLFGSERIAGVMDKLGLEDGDVITHSMISKSIESAQKKVEERNFGIRKRLLEYDDVMNSQREVVYDIRSHILHGKNMRDYIFDIMEDTIEDAVDNHIDPKLYPEEWDWQGLSEVIARTFLTQLEHIIPKEDRHTFNPESLTDRLIEYLKKLYEQREKHIGEELMRKIERYRLLQVIDEKWKDHLYEMDQLKEGIGLRAYGQKDPLIEYKTESYKLFMDLLSDMKKITLSLIPLTQEEILKEREHRQKHRADTHTEHKSFGGYGVSGGEDNMVNKTTTNAGDSAEPQKKKPITRSRPRIGRNDKCHCGSGKKYKSCCWNRDRQRKKAA